MLRKLIENLKTFLKFHTQGTISSPKLARRLGAKVGDNCRLINVTFSSEPYLVTIGNHVSATQVHFETHDGGVWIFRDKHPNWDVIKKITIGNNVFIGKGAIILPGSIIGDNVVVGAGAVVSGVLSDGYVYAGIPARKIKSIDSYYEKLSLECYETKYMTPEDKRSYLIDKIQ